MRETHKDRLLKYLKDYGHITTLEAIQHLGNTRLSATIHTLRHKDNYSIYSEDIQVENRWGGTTTITRYHAQRNPLTNELLQNAI